MKSTDPLLEKRIAKIKGKRDKLRDLATLDPLTGLYNRHALQSLYAELIRPAMENDRRDPGREEGAAPKPSCIGAIYLDLDNFKKVNDTHGHDTGDIVLKSVAQTLKAITRRTDIAARLGGEELVIIGDFGNQTHLKALAEEIREKIQEITFTSSAEKQESFNVTASIGCASFDPLLQTMELKKLLDQADQGTIAAKKQGKNCVVMIGASAPIGEEDISDPRPKDPLFTRRMDKGRREKVTARYKDLKRDKKALFLLGRKTAEYRLASRTDALTKIHNRRGLQDRYNNLLGNLNRAKKERTIGVMLLDLDFFGQINKNHSHDVGDEALTYFAQTMKEAFRQEDIVGRWGGEEFMVVGAFKDEGDMKKALDRLYKNLKEKPFVTSAGVSVPFTFSAGVTTFGSADGCTLSDAKAQADMNLYLAKRAGRNRYMWGAFTPALTPKG